MDRFPAGDGVRDGAHIRRATLGARQLAAAASPAGAGLFELRLDVGRTQRRITYYFAPGQRIVLLTAFRKQRQTERAEIRRARRAMRLCIAEGHTIKEDD